MHRIILTVALVGCLTAGQQVLAQSSGGGGSGSSGSSGTTGATSSGTLTQPNATPPAGVPGGNPGGVVSPNPGNPTGRTDPAVGTIRTPDTQQPGTPRTNSAVGGTPSGQSGANQTDRSMNTTGGSTTGAAPPQRQPRAADIPAEKYEERSAEDRELDKKMRICRGC
jgi:hypothetical protein